MKTEFVLVDCENVQPKKALFGSQLMEDELDRLIEQLTKRGVIKIAEGKVQYDLPT